PAQGDTEPEPPRARGSDLPAGHRLAGAGRGAERFPRETSAALATRVDVATDHDRPLTRDPTDAPLFRLLVGAGARVAYEDFLDAADLFSPFATVSSIRRESDSSPTA